MSARGFLAFAGAALLGACAPPETGVRDLYPVIVVDPERVDFGEVGVGPGLFGERPIFVSNTGRAELNVESLTLEGQVEAFSLDVETPFEVVDGAEVVLPVRFTPPQEYRDYTGRVVIGSNDPETPTVVVPIAGTGVAAPVPDIEILPYRTIESSDDIPYGETEQLVFDIANLGQADLVIDEIVVEVDPGANPATFTLEWPTDPAADRTLAPNGSEPVLVRYAPDDETGETATVTIRSDDPDEPEITVLLVGMGGGPYFEPPVAAIDCPAQALLTGPEWIHLDGSGSYDPNGGALTYEWSVLVRPPGADPNIPLDPDDTPEVDLYVDVAGSWLVSLVVRNELGAASDAALCAFDAVPEDDIHVELTWDGASADIDLHLVQSGYDLFSKPEDCYWCNKSPDWGVESDTNDDPRLDIDDRAGYGPENINVYRPADGVYKVAVHFWKANGTPNQVATVKVWVDGANVHEESMPMTTNQVWEVGEIYTSSGVPAWIPYMAPQSTPYDPGTVSCPQN